MLLELSSGVFVAKGLASLEWPEHGFGTRHSIWPEPERLAVCRQIHSDIVREATAPGPQGDGDALITNEPGLLVGVKTADCVPVLLADERHLAVAAIHAGWRGTAAEIVLRTLEQMAARYGTAASDVHAAIGPCISKCCYEVGGDVAGRFGKWLPAVRSEGKQMLDLVRANREQLRSAGVMEWRVESGAPCTFCRPDQLHSFRRDGDEAGRMISAIGIR